MTCRMRRFSDAEAMSIRAISGRLAPRVQTVAEAAAELGLTPVQVKMFTRLFGLNRLPYDPSLPLDALLRRALDGLGEQDPEGLRRASHLVHCHTLPQVRILPGRLGAGLPADLECFSLTMAHCASGLLGLGLLADLVPSGRTGLLLIGEKAFHPKIRLIADTTIMSEGAVALSLGHGAGPWRLRGYHMSHAGQTSVNRGHRHEVARLPQDYTGFVRDHIGAALDGFGITAGALRMILPHNVNTVSWAATARAIGLPIGRIYLGNVAAFGHCFGADPLLNLLDAAAETRPGDLVLCVSVGMGMTAASALIEITAPVHAGSGLAVTSIPQSQENTTCP